MTSKAPKRMESAEQPRERFTNQKRFVATKKDCAAKWPMEGEGFKCGLCGHRFTVGEGVRWVYANGNTPSYRNFFTCDSCDGEDVLERRTSAGDVAKSLEFDEIVIAAKFNHAARLTAELQKMVANAENVSVHWMERAEKAERQLQEARAEIERFRDALRKLVLVIDAVEASPSYQGVFVLNHIHGGKYIGPTWEDELAAARKALELKVGS